MLPLVLGFYIAYLDMMKIFLEKYMENYDIGFLHGYRDGLFLCGKHNS